MTERQQKSKKMLIHTFEYLEILSRKKNKSKNNQDNVCLFRMFLLNRIKFKNIYSHEKRVN